MRAFCNTRSYFHMEKAALVTNFPFSRKMLMSKKYERPSLFFSIKKLMLGCLDDQYSLNFSEWSREENNTNVINIPSIKYRVQSVKAIFKPFILKTTHKIVS